MSQLFTIYICRYTPKTQCICITHSSHVYLCIDLSSSLSHTLNFEAVLIILVVSFFALVPFMLSLMHVLCFHALLGKNSYTYT